jgi:hypothetical protein
MKRIAIVGAIVATSLLGHGQTTPPGGTWTTLSAAWDILPIHMSLMSDKTLLIWNRSRVGITYRQASIGNYPSYDSATLWDYTPEIFCSGHVHQWDGDLVIGGGHVTDGNGIDDITVTGFDQDPPFQGSSTMATPRWYPTCTLLPNRRMFINSGVNNNQQTTVPELWVNGVPSGAHIAQLPQHAIDATYPHLFVDPKDGHAIFFAVGIGGYANQKYNLISSTWSNYVTIPSGITNVQGVYPSSVMVNGVVVRSGGGASWNSHDAVGTTLYIDLNATTPAWQQGPSMQYGRMHHTLVGLADGKVLAVGGTRRDTTVDDTVRAQPEIWDPASPTTAWRLLATPSSAIGRGYHSTALLLPDARVMVAGGEPDDSTHRTSQIYSPPYGNRNDWASVRPTIDTAPSVIRYGETFQVSSTFSSDTPVGKVVLASLGSTTHAFNQDQRVLFLDFTGDPSSITVTAPATTFKAPPGYYMLFVLDQGGIPSAARIVQLKDLSMIFVAPTLVEGSYNGTAANSQLYLGENIYLGNGIVSSSNVAVEVTAEGTASTNVTPTIRAQIESKCSVATTCVVSLYNWSTSQYVQIGSGSVGTTENLISVVSTWVSTLTNPYIRSTDKLIRAKFRWVLDNDTTFTVSADAIELGIRD